MKSEQGTTTGAPTMKRAVISFTGGIEERDGRVFAKCDHAPILTYGDTADQALERMTRAIGVYVEMLADRGELALAIRAGRIQVDFTPLPGPTESWTKTLIEKVKERFVAQVPALATA